jgi:hypothetical protein
MIRIPVNRTFVARRALISIENNRRLRLNPVEVEHLRRFFYVPEPFSIDMQALTGLSLSRTQVSKTHHHLCPQMNPWIIDCVELRFGGNAYDVEFCGTRYRTVLIR